MDYLLIFVKNPVKGKVKTRIAATVGDEEALRIYVELLGHTRRIAIQIHNTRRNVFYSHFINTADEWLNVDFEKHLQMEGDLGEKMAEGFRTVFENGATKAVIIGSDCANLTTAIVRSAYEQLEMNDFVIGPAIDGGYYLLGMKQFSPEIFENIAWSTEQVLAQTIAIMEQQQQSYALLPTLSDIDYEEDWLKYGW